jgi:hypothetical protein
VTTVKIQAAISVLLDMGAMAAGVVVAVVVVARSASLARATLRRK